MNDSTLAKLLLVLIIIPILVVVFGEDRFRYECQDPKNWESESCNLPSCESTGVCTDYIFGRKIGDDKVNDDDDVIIKNNEGENCGK